MSHAITLAVVRSQVTESFRQYRLVDGAEPRESILLKGGHYWGRRFEVGTGYAIWNAQTDELKIYSTAGKLLGSIANVSATDAPQRRAA